MHARLSRRSFLAASAGLLLAGACGNDDDEVRVDKKDVSTPGTPALVIASYVHTAGIENRVTLALIKDDGPVRPTTRTVTFTDPGGQRLGEVDATLQEEGIELPYLLVRQRFPRPGVYEAVVEHDGTRLTAALEVADPAQVQIPIPGRSMISLPTPTLADPRGVNPICTRQPACPLHDTSLDAALAEKRPVALLFATPALCQSRLCGPVLDNLLAVRDGFAGTVRFLHVEIFTDMTGKTVNDAVRGYHLESEPFLFLAGADGVVRDRLDNAFDRVELREALTRLVA